MPAYNAEKYIRQSIDSILNQTFSDFLLLIIDDGSVDETENIIRSYTDQRIVYVKNEKNVGVKETLNKGILLSETEYIARMDADDLAVPERLEWQVAFMDANPEVGVSGGHFEFFGDETSLVKMPLTDAAIKAKLFFFSGFCHPTIIMRTQILKDNNLLYGSPIAYPDDFGHRINEMEDSGLWHRLKRITKFANIDKVLLRYRKEGQNISGKNVRDIHNRKKVLYHYLLNEVGMTEFPEDEVLFLFSLQSFKDTPNIDNIKKYKTYLDKLIAANERSNIYDPEQFKVAVNRVWEQFFYFLTSMKNKYVFRYWRVSGGLNVQQMIYLLKFRIRSNVK
ncbi:MAG: epsE 1 [Bacteroidetes bacterium]|nr:epsE 1 [Bacteroidota bacterium]